MSLYYRLLRRAVWVYLIMICYERDRAVETEKNYTGKRGE